MGGCTLVCQKSGLVLQGAVVKLPWMDEDLRRRELRQADKLKLQAVPVLSINDSFLYKKRKSVSGTSQARCDETKDSLA